VDGLMARYLVFNTQNQANTAQGIIFGDGKTRFAARGYTLHADGSIIGKVMGVDAPNNQRTVRWDVPRQRLDGKWVIAHPGDQSAEWDAIAAAALAKLGAVTAEEWSASWFPKAGP
jgi:hypothetical protein